MSREKHLRDSQMAKPGGLLKELDVGDEGDQGQGQRRDLGSGNQRKTGAFAKIQWLLGLKSGVLMNWFSFRLYMRCP